MAWQEVSPMMNFQRKRNGDASIRRRWYLKRNIRRKSHLDKVEKYAVLATIDKKELTIPFLNIAENGGYPPTQNGDIRSLFWLFSLMALQN